MRRILIAVSTLGGRGLAALATLCEEGSRRLIRCPHCGRSTYYGRACKYQEEDRS